LPPAFASRFEVTFCDLKGFGPTRRSRLSAKYQNPFSQHILRIRVEQKAVIKKYLTTATDGKRYETFDKDVELNEEATCNEYLQVRTEHGNCERRLRLFPPKAVLGPTFTSGKTSRPTASVFFVSAAKGGGHEKNGKNADQAASQTRAEARA
jgi:hypothetical protein